MDSTDFAEEVFFVLFDFVVDFFFVEELFFLVCAILKSPVGPSNKVR